VPKDLGAPARILVTDPSLAPAQPEFRVLALLYDLPTFGRVVVIEEIPQIPVVEFNSWWEHQATLNRSPGVHGTTTAVTVRGAVEAFITTAEDGSRSDIRWLEGDIEIVIEGPTLDRDQVVALANSI
jgi:hypothetical protein